MAHIRVELKDVCIGSFFTGFKNAAGDINFISDIEKTDKKHPAYKKLPYNVKILSHDNCTFGLYFESWNSANTFKERLLNGSKHGIDESGSHQKCVGMQA